MPLPFYEDCINHVCLQSGPQQQETGAAGATMEHPLTDLGSQAGPHPSDAFVETASESNTMGVQEREGGIEEPGTPGERMVSLAVGIAECGLEAEGNAGHMQCCILPGWPGRVKGVWGHGSSGRSDTSSVAFEWA